MQDLDLEFSDLMENLYIATHLMRKYNLPRRYGTDDALYLNEVQTLKHISEHPRISLSDLGTRTHRTKGATSMMINKLVSKGLVSKCSAADDVRRHELSLTEKGATVDRAHLEYDTFHYGEILDFMPGICPEDFRRANKILVALIAYYLS